MSEEPEDRDDIGDDVENQDDIRDDTDVTDETLEEDEYVDIEEELEAQPREEPGRFRTLGEYKDRFVGFFRSDTDTDRWSKRPAVGDTKINRRGVITGIGALAVGGYAATELAEERPPEAGGPVPPEAGGNETDGAAAAISNAEEYAWDTEEELLEETGFCYAQPDSETGDNYLGTLRVSDVEEALDEEDVSGQDPTGALSAEEVSMTLDDITEVQGTYAVDVDRKQGNNGDYNMFVQLVGEEDGGTYVTRGGAMEISDLQFEEIFEYTQCN